MNKKKLLAYFGLFLFFMILPASFGTLSSDSSWNTAKLLEWSNGYFWRGFSIGIIVEIIIIFIIWSVDYLLEKKDE